jgi:hypothetical protein
VQQIHDLDLPVYAGGRALGPSPRRADTADADGWAATASGAHKLLCDPGVPRHDGGITPRLA